MKSLAFRDILGGSIHVYSNLKKPNQKRWKRFFEGYEELKHTGNIIIYRTSKNKCKKIGLRRI